MENIGKIRQIVLIAHVISIISKNNFKIISRNLSLKFPIYFPNKIKKCEFKKTKGNGEQFRRNEKIFEFSFHPRGNYFSI